MSMAVPIIQRSKLNKILKINKIAREANSKFKQEFTHILLVHDGVNQAQSLIRKYEIHKSPF